MTNLEMYIAFSYLMLFIPCIDKGKFLHFIIWSLSPITLPMLLGIYLNENFKK